MRTRVGYTGGRHQDPTYHDLGDHTESLQIDFDPNVISYRQLLELFWDAHNPCARPFSRQYMSAIFVDGPEQRRLAEETKAAHAEKQGREVRTEIADLRTFYLAEAYHQKYRLRAARDVCAELTRHYPDLETFIHSTAVTRANAWLAGYGTPAIVDAELPRAGLSESAIRTIRDRLRR